MKTLLILGVFHTIGDFYLQFAGISKNKAEKMGVLFLHAALYAVSMGVVFLCTPFFKALISWTIISLTHLIIDRIKIAYDKKHGKKKLYSFVLDQILHLLIIFGCYMLFMRGNPGFVQRNIYLLPWFSTALIYVTILSIIVKPTAVLISKVFESRPQKEADNENEASDPGAGTLIGILERVIVVALVLLNSPSAVGFVLTAKSVARFKQLENNQGFAERYLIGTLLSVGIALAAVLLIPMLC